MNNARSRQAAVQDRGVFPVFTRSTPERGVPAVTVAGSHDEQLRATKLAAKALATLHGLTLAEKPSRELRRELKELRKFAKEFKELAPAIAKQAKRFADQLEEAAARIGEPDAHGPVHGAFEPSQLLVSAEAAMIVDLDGFAVGERD